MYNSSNVAIWICIIFKCFYIFFCRFNTPVSSCYSKERSCYLFWRECSKLSVAVQQRRRNDMEDARIQRMYQHAAGCSRADLWNYLHRLSGYRILLGGSGCRYTAYTRGCSGIRGIKSGTGIAFILSCVIEQSAMERTGWVRSIVRAIGRSGLA